MENQRELNLTITVDNIGNATIEIFDNETGDEASFSVDASVNCNNAEELAKEIGYELLSWVDLAREN